GVLAGAAGLFPVLVVEWSLAGRRLAIADLGSADDAFDLVLAANSLDVDLEVKLAHARDDRLTGLRVNVHPERGILSHEPVQSLGKLVVIGPLRRLDGQIDDRLSRIDAFERHIRAFGAIRVAGGALQAHHGHDITGGRGIDVFFLVGVHAQDPADPRPLALSRIEVKGSFGQRSLVDPHVGDLTERFLDQLERHGHKRCVGVGRQGNLGHAVVVVLGKDLAIQRGGQVAADRVQERLHPLVAIGGTDHDRTELLGDRPLADRLVDQVERNINFLQKQFHDLVGDHGERLEHPLTSTFGGLDQIGRAWLGTDVLAVVTAEEDSLAFDQVDHALEVRLGPDRQLERYRRQVELGLELLDHVGRIGAGAIHLVDEGDSWDGIPLHLAIDGDRLRLDASHGAEDQHSSVEHAERPLDLDGEVDVARSVDDVDRLVVPVDSGRSRGDRDPSLLLQLHVVHHGPFTLDLLDHVGTARVIEHALRQCGLARVDVGGDSDVSIVFQVFHSQNILSPQTKGGTPLVWATNHTTSWEAGGFLTRSSSTGWKACRRVGTEAHQKTADQEA